MHLVDSRFVVTFQEEDILGSSALGIDMEGAGWSHGSGRIKLSVNNGGRYGLYVLAILLSIFVQETRFKAPFYILDRTSEIYFVNQLFSQLINSMQLPRWIHGLI